MIRTASYVNHEGREINLKEGCIRIDSVNIPDWSLEPVTSNNRLMRFRNAPRDTQITGIVFSVDAEESLAARRKLYEIIAADLIDDGKSVPPNGRLYVNGAYMPGYFRASSKDRFWLADNATDITLTFWSANPLWRVPQVRNLLTTDVGTGLNFPYDYDYDLGTGGKGSSVLTNEGLIPSPLLIEAYGPVTDPALTIDGNLYQVKYTLLTGDKLTIDGDAKTITVTLKDGTTINVFDKRVGTISDGSGECVFHKLPHGDHIVHWDGSFVCRVTLLRLSYEPEW